MSKRVMLLLAVFLLVLTNTALAVNWVYVAKDSNSDFFIDSETIATDSGSIVFWAGRIFEKPESDNIKTAYIKFEVRLAVPRTSRHLYVRAFDSNKQELVLQPEPGGWREVPAGSPVNQCIEVALTFARMRQATTVDQEGALRFHYEYQADSQAGPYIRIMNGAIKDPRGFWQALLPLQPPPGARGGYGLIGDDSLLGKEPGFGLRQLGGIARRYISVDSIYVRQPAGFGDIGVQDGVFITLDAMNDTTLGWVFFDLRPKFEADLKKNFSLGP